MNTKDLLILDLTENKIKKIGLITNASLTNSLNHAEVQTIVQTALFSIANITKEAIIKHDYWYEKDFFQIEINIETSSGKYKYSIIPN